MLYYFNNFEHVFLAFGTPKGRIWNLVKYLRWSVFAKNSQQLKAINYFRKRPAS